MCSTSSAAAPFTPRELTTLTAPVEALLQVRPSADINFIRETACRNTKRFAISRGEKNRTRTAVTLAPFGTVHYKKAFASHVSQR